MKLLALDTSSSACSVALQKDEKIISRHEIIPKQQTDQLLPMIHDLLTEANVQLNQLNAIAFGCGPGSFTGVRIGLSVAQGLGFGAELPLIPISSLAAMAQTALEFHGMEKVLVAVDGRVNDVYWGVYQSSSKLMQLIQPEKILTPETLTWGDDSWHGIGNAWEVYQNRILYKPKAVNALLLPHAEAILTLAREKYEKHQWISPAQAHPNYLRDEVAYKSGNTV